MSRYDDPREKEFLILAIAASSKYIFIGLIVIIAMVKCAFGEEIDPMDDSIMTRRAIVAIITVKDTTTQCGFYVAYVTENSVTEARLEEIRKRPHIIDAHKRLQEEAPRFFGGNLFDTDIYSFAEFAKDFDVDPDIKIHNIFIYGHDKEKLYARDNPNLKDCCTLYNPNTQQGILYLKDYDIYGSSSESKKIYRYWKCYGAYATSYSDERFSHFTNKERLY